jgi:hypothetical protein
MEYVDNRRPVPEGVEAEKRLSGNREWIEDRVGRVMKRVLGFVCRAETAGDSPGVCANLRDLFGEVCA